MCLFRFFICADILGLAKLHWVTWENQTLMPQINRCKLMNVVYTKRCGNNLKRIIMWEVMMGLFNREQAAKSGIVCGGSVGCDCPKPATEHENSVAMSLSLRLAMSFHLLTEWALTLRICLYYLLAVGYRGGSGKADDEDLTLTLYFLGDVISVCFIYSCCSLILSNVH